MYRTRYGVSNRKRYVQLLNAVRSRKKARRSGLCWTGARQRQRKPARTGCGPAPRLTDRTENGMLLAMSTPQLPIPSADQVRARLQGLSHAQVKALAEASAAPFTTLWKIRSGETADPRIETVRSIWPHLDALQAN